jgi:hypothetical protein
MPSEIKSRRLKWAGHVARMGERSNVRKREGGGDHLEDPGVCERIILKWILEKWDEAWTGSSLLGIGTGGGLL